MNLLQLILDYKHHIIQRTYTRRPETATKHKLTILLILLLLRPYDNLLKANSVYEPSHQALQPGFIYSATLRAGLSPHEDTSSNAEHENTFKPLLKRQKADDLP